MIILHGAIALTALAIAVVVLFVGKAVDIVGWVRRRKACEPKPNPYGTLISTKQSNESGPEASGLEGDRWE